MNSRELIIVAVLGSAMAFGTPAKPSGSQIEFDPPIIEPARCTLLDLFNPDC